MRHFKHISINLIVAFWCVITLKNLFLLSNRSFNIPPPSMFLFPPLATTEFSIPMRSRLLRILNASRARCSYRRASRRKPGYLSSPRVGLWLQLPWHLSICPFVLGVLSLYFAECEVSQRPLAHSCRNVYTWLCCSPLNWITPVYSSYATVISHTQTFILFFFWQVETIPLITWMENSFCSESLLENWPMFYEVADKNIGTGCAAKNKEMI